MKKEAAAEKVLKELKSRYVESSQQALKRRAELSRIRLKRLAKQSPSSGDLRVRERKQFSAAKRLELRSSCPPAANRSQDDDDVRVFPMLNEEIEDSEEMGIIAPLPDLALFRDSVIPGFDSSTSDNPDNGNSKPEKPKLK